MDLTILKRNISLHKLGISKLDGVEKEVYDYLIAHLSNLNRYEYERHPDFLFFGDSADSVVIEYEIEDKYLWIIYDPIWTFFHHVIRLSYVETQSLLTWWFVEEFDLVVELCLSIHERNFLHKQDYF